MRIGILLVVLSLWVLSCKEDVDKSYDIQLVNKVSRTNVISARTIMDNKSIEIEVDSLGPELQGLNFKNTIMAECTPLYIVFGTGAQAYNVFTIYSRGQMITLEPDGNTFRSTLKGDENVTYVQSMFDSLYSHTKANDLNAIHDKVLSIIQDTKYPCLNSFKTLMVLQSDQRMKFSKEDSTEIIKFFVKQDTANNPMMRSLARTWLGMSPQKQSSNAPSARPNTMPSGPVQLNRTE